jgi:hypothetical protein
MSGLLYQWGGLAWSLAGSAVLLMGCWLVTLALPVTRPSPARTASTSLQRSPQS